MQMLWDVGAEVLGAVAVSSMAESDVDAAVVSHAAIKGAGAVYADAACDIDVCCCCRCWCMQIL